jgi:hypothetical protein
MMVALNSLNNTKNFSSLRIIPNMRPPNAKVWPGSVAGQARADAP